ncbi:hypothetical protein C5Y96_13210 [Blastopirellula marina]|uniref:Uncharacterized protein n=1 Tax=Blastopirellula marina TaxID=124 RepID=A0A2S8FGK9_9BACT|nr:MULTISPECIES: hypothetical protein [Pirellulaceae]PQO31295.1 hypothetical protein C5Y96_13210 [Blastopirellula marina]RCS51689.1 hypothetical protein DTL36_13220 [Bremerella cremea]
MLTKTLVWSGILSAALLSMASTANAGHFDHRHRLVDDIERLHHATEEFYQEVRHHEGFSSLTFEAKALLREVDHFCDTARRNGSLTHLRHDFDEVSTEMRHVQHDFRRAWHGCHRPDRHVLSAWAEVERAFDRVYFDLYEAHCGYIQYTCRIGNVHDHGHHDDHYNDHQFRPDYGHYQPQPRPYPQPGIQFGTKDGKINVKLGNGAPAWAHMLKGAIK